MKIKLPMLKLQTNYGCKSMFLMKLFEERLDYYIKDKISKSCKNNYVMLRSEL
jgi:hypothetical protein